MGARLTERRRVLRVLLGASVFTLFGCGTGGNDDTGEGGDGDGDSDGACETIPEETAGPYPGDGSNGPNSLTLSDIVRSDIRSSVGDASGTAEGVLLTVTLTLVGSDCAPLAGQAVYLWHCDRAGDYSMYTGAATGENYLRGVQESDDAGKVTFTTIFPACYPGRWPHMHFEIFSSLDAASAGANKLHTSQLAFPKETCDVVFATEGYEASVSNLGELSLESDNVFRDGADLQVADVSGSVSAGYEATLRVAIPT